MVDIGLRSILMKTPVVFITVIALLVNVAGCNRQQAKIWQVPPVITPGTHCGEPPSDDIILFDSNDVSQWVAADGKSPIKWKVEDDYMEVVPKSGYILTKRGFGDCQLHIEWATPPKLKATARNGATVGYF